MCFCLVGQWAELESMDLKELSDRLASILIAGDRANELLIFHLEERDSAAMWGRRESLLRRTKVQDSQNE